MLKHAALLVALLILMALIALGVQEPEPAASGSLLRQHGPLERAMKPWVRWTTASTEDRVIWVLLLLVIAVIVGGTINGTEPLGPS
jgi:hypothetical protein